MIPRLDNTNLITLQCITIYAFVPAGDIQWVGLGSLQKNQQRTYRAVKVWIFNSVH